MKICYGKTRTDFLDSPIDWKVKEKIHLAIYATRDMIENSSFSICPIFSVIDSHHHSSSFPSTFPICHWEEA